AMRDGRRVLLLQTGVAKVEHLETLQWVNGALADHLTSYGGLLDSSGGQTTAVEWIESGATASYGTVSEPCNHPQKFPHPQLLLLHYLQGSTAVEAYWKSVAWPQQGVFIGEPLAAPFAVTP
ncbi:MAG TPA: TIGR03790 family protein, partial [Burkholderiaceae bacterium]|nr:TIGR03790 family protein [Burkholderiaceae bacterium]